MGIRWKAVGLTFLLVLSLSAMALAAGGPPPRATMVGKPAPGFATANIKGERVDLKEILVGGKAVVLNFWGLRCGACLAEIPVLNALQEKHAGVARFIGVNTDGVDAPFLEKQMAAGEIVIRYDVVPDAEMALIDLYKMTAAPYTVVIDPGGTVRYQHEDYRPGDEKELDQAIEDAIRKPAR